MLSQQSVAQWLQNILDNNTSKTFIKITKPIKNKTFSRIFIWLLTNNCSLDKNKINPKNCIFDW